MSHDDRNITRHKIRGIHGKSGLYKKRGLRNLLIRRIRTNLLYARLRSLIPKPGSRTNKFAENTIPRSGDETRSDLSDTESCTSSLMESKEIQRNNLADDPCELPISYSCYQDTANSLPSVRIEKVLGSHEHLMIRIITFKAFNALPSTLFLVLEQENLDIVHAHRSFTGEKVFHTIEATVEKPSTLDLDALSQKLYLWAGKGPQ